MGYENSRADYTATYCAPGIKNYHSNANATASYAKTPFYIPVIKYNNTAFKAYSEVKK